MYEAAEYGAQEPEQPSIMDDLAVALKSLETACDVLDQVQHGPSAEKRLEAIPPSGAKSLAVSVVKKAEEVRERAQHVRRVIGQL